MQAYPSFLPGYSTLKALRYAIEEFPRHTQSMLSAERQRLEEEPGDVKHNILSQLVTASSKEKKDAALSDPEMRGNLFVSVSPHESSQLLCKVLKHKFEHNLHGTLLMTSPDSSCHSSCLILTFSPRYLQQLVSKPRPTRSASHLQC